MRENVFPKMYSPKIRISMNYISKHYLEEKGEKNIVLS